jgi:hypothetical protein
VTPDDPANIPRPTKPTAPARAPDAVREGDYLVVRKRGAKLPPGCIFCKAAEAKRVSFTLRKFNLPLTGWLLLFSPILLLMYGVSPAAKFEAGLCSSHSSEERLRRRSALRFLWIVIAILALAAGAMWRSPKSEVGAGIALLGILLLPIAVNFALVQRNGLKAHHSDGRYLWVDGVSPEYLRELDEIGGES